ncbi:MAG: saccharopine dehydrogenase NADP-binding domain-containing protein [Bacteroidetes bacterium]|nr:saccharopine dehydrogenase NADP-binding domain-containing protein [Bacteroidota bacterium]MBU1717793.1 saccharopine dehydrogenase NADP-binding domain-containing protein [Bacteroidota bacterium]
MKIIILGAGLVGGPMAADLAADSNLDVTVADINPKSLEKAKALNNAMKTLQKDLSKPEEVTLLVRDYDMAINAVPGWMGYQTLEAIIKAGKNVVDIAFFPEDPFQLDNLAKEMGVTAVMDCGVAPGMSNVLIGYADHLFDETLNAEIYVGGLPVVREWPYEYKAVFSPADVIEEYTRPARYVENGALVIREALSDPEYMHFDGVGTLESFNSDGLRSLADTIKAPNLKEKTLRYPGHIQIMKILRETGFFSKEPMNINGVEISPLDFTSKILFPAWQMKEGDEDVTVMKVIIDGMKDGRKLRYEYDLHDRFDKVSGVHSMARTTGYTATVALRMIAAGLYQQKGVSVPEFIGKHPECVKFLLDGLKQRNVVYQERIIEG